MIRILCLVGLWAGLSPAFAENKKWTLSECVAFALQNNLTIQEQWVAEDRNELWLEKSKMDRLPSLNSSASHNYNFGRTIDPFTNQFGTQRIQSNSFTLGSGVVLYNGFRLKNTIYQMELQGEAIEYRNEVLKNQISLNVVEAYLQIVFAEKQHEVVRTQALSTLAQQEMAGLLVDAGASNKSAYLNLKAQVARDNWNIQSAKSSIRLAYINLLQIMQMPDDQNFEIVIPQIQDAATEPLSSMNEVIQVGLETLPEIKLANTQLNVSNLGIDVAEAGLYPRLSMFANMSTLYSGSRLERYNPQARQVPIGFVDGTNQVVFTEYMDYETKTTPFGTQFTDNFGQAVGLSLSIPIFNNHQVKTNIADAKLNLKLDELNLERTRMQIRSDIAMAFTDYQNAEAMYQAAISDEEAQRENFNFAQKRHEAGLLTTVELLLAKTSWTNAQTELERARFELIFSHTRLLFYQKGSVQLPVH